jgi:hypothetical protein
MAETLADRPSNQAFPLWKKGTWQQLIPLYMRKKINQPVLFVHHVSPHVQEIKGYFVQKGAPHREAEDFYHVYENRNWTGTRGNFIKYWKIAAARWIASIWKMPSHSLPEAFQ